MKNRKRIKAFRFIQASDAHLGYMQYNLTERRDDFLKAFEEFTTKAKELSPDLLVFAGDLFNSPHPSNPVLAEAIELIDSLKVPFLVVPGSHDKAYSTLVGTVLEPLHRGGHIHYLPTKPYEKGDVYVYGMTNFRRRTDFTTEAREFFEKYPPKPRGKYNIFVLHQGVDFPSLNLHPSQVEMRPEELPKGFQYYASGHLHNPTILRFDDSIFAYSGSLETFEYTEYEYEKSFYLVEMGRDGEAEVKTIPLSKQRPFQVLRQDCTGLKPAEIEEKTREMISKSDRSGAILVLVLEGTLLQGLTRADVNYEAVRKEATKALYVHFVNNLRTAEEEALPIAMTSAESLYSRASARLNEHYGDLFKEKAPQYAGLTIDLVNIFSSKELKRIERQRMAEKKIDAFYGEISQ